MEMHVSGGQPPASRTGLRNPFPSSHSIAFKYAFNIALAMQNANDAKVVLIHEVINADGLKSRDRPGAKILKPGVAGTIAWAHQGVESQ